MELKWPGEYLMLGSWWILGALLWFAAPRKQSQQESLRGLLGQYYDQLERANPAGARRDAPYRPAQQ